VIGSLLNISQFSRADVGRKGESPVMRKYHAGFGREGACFPPDFFWAWRRTLTSGDSEGRVHILIPGITCNYRVFSWREVGEGR
jgi:hypothetical protein